MGLRCLLGHDFDEPETERERNEEGNEVVVTVREVKTCKRCGEKQVVSENKEITSIDQLRESATGEPASGSSAGSEPAATTGGAADDEWSTDDLSGGGTESSEAATAADTQETVEPDEDPIERGVADIIEQAEKDDDMLQDTPEPESTPDTADADTADADAETDDVPVHPGQRSAAAEDSEDTDPADDDGVILDDEEASPPEEGRRQWEEEVSPEEVPGDDLNVGESSPHDDDDAEILDAGPETSTADTEPSSEPEPSEPTTSEPQGRSTPSAVESEDAEIMDAGPEIGGTGPDEQSTEPEPTEPSSEPEPTEASSGRGETEEGHMPWPEAPNEDEGDDATAPDGPTDIDFGGESSADDDASAEVSSAAADEDRANGHRTETGEPSDASTGPSANVDLQQSSRDAELEYHCPECGLTRDVGNSSMRAGDICPECRVGYIVEQQKAE